MTKDIRGYVTLFLRDREGHIVHRYENSNLIVSSGKSLMANLFRGEKAEPISYIALGSGGSEVLPSDVDLEIELSPRKPFTSNTFSPENSGALVLMGPREREVVKFVAKDAGSRGNDITVKISQADEESVDIMIYNINIGDASNEEYRKVNMKKSSDDFLINRINDHSQLITAHFLGRGLPLDLDWTELSGGTDAEVTLTASFGFNECNGKICEAGLFNAEKEGTMYSRIVFPEINKTEDLSLSLIWKIAL